MSALHFPWTETILTGFVLLAGGVDDLRSRKIHNHLILLLLPFVLAGVFLIKGPQGLLPAFAGLITALVIGLPLTLAKVIGGGDFKLLLLFGLTLNATGVFFSFICALPWALFLGIVKLALDRNLKSFASNLFSLAKLKKPESQQLHTIPFSIALIFGWLTFIITLKHMRIF